MFPYENEKQKTKKKNWLKVGIKSFSILKYLETFFVFVFQTKTKQNKKFFFRGVIKNELFNHKKKKKNEITT